MKKLIALLLAMLMVVGLFAGCAEQPAGTEAQGTEGTKATEGTTATEPSAKDPDPVTITWWVYQDDRTDAIHEKLFADLMALYPWITIEPTFLPYDSGPELMSVAFATKDTPNIIGDGYGRLGQGLEAGLGLDITDVILANEANMKALPIDGVFDGVYTYYPTGYGGAYSISVNMDLAEEIGCTEYFPEDKLQWSYEDFLTCLRMAKEKGYYGIDLFAGSQSSDMWYYTFFLANGVDITDGGVSRVTVNDPEYQAKALEVLTLLKTIVDEGLCQPGAATMLDQESQPIWFTGKMLFCHGAFSNVGTWQNAVADGTSVVENFDMFAVPTPTGDYVPDSGSFGNSGIAAFKSDNEAENEAAKLCLDAIMSGKVQYLQECNDAQPGNPSATWVVENWTDEDMIRINKNVGNPYSAAHSRSEFGVLRGWWADFRLTFYPQLQDYYAGNITAEEMLANWAANGTAVIEAANAKA